MITKRITYLDYNGNERTENFDFHLNKVEALEFAMSIDGNLTDYVKECVEKDNKAALIMMVKTIVEKSYGKKSEDGRRFMKSDEISRSFIETEAYVSLMTELVSNSEKAAEFINGVLTEITPANKE
jgi:hypothetical protein